MQTVVESGAASTTARRVFIALMLLSGGAPFTGCESFGPILGSDVEAVATAYCTALTGVQPNSQSSSQSSSPSVQCLDPPVKLRDPSARGGATVSLRTGPATQGPTAFVRTGVLAPIDGHSSSGMPNTLIAPTTTSGEADYREHWAVPVVMGVSAPATSFGVPMPHLSFETFAGAQARNKSLGFTLTETGLPGFAAASQSYTTFDPVIGVGAQYYLGTYGGVATSLGADVTVEPTLSDHTALAPSPNLPGVTYAVSVPGHTSVAGAISLNFDIAPPPAVITSRRLPDVK